MRTSVHLTADVIIAGFACYVLSSNRPAVRRRNMPHTIAEMRALAEQWIAALQN
jgi:hypothetical protein